MPRLPPSAACCPPPPVATTWSAAPPCSALLTSHISARLSACCSWQNFELNGGSVPKDKHARSVLDRSVAHVIKELKAEHKLPASCQLARTYVIKDCMKVGDQAVKHV